MKDKKPCSVDGCDRVAVARGLCRVCHQRGRRAALRAERPAPELKPIAAEATIYSEPIESFHVRLTVAERRTLMRAAHKHGMSASALIRAWIRGAI